MNPDLADAFVQFSRNERFGTCVDCPRQVRGNVREAYPEFCVNTKRHDHNISFAELIAAYEVEKRSERLLGDMSKVESLPVITCAVRAFESNYLAEAKEELIQENNTRLYGE